MKTMIKTLPILIGLISSAPALAQTGDAARGEYVLAMAGCVACHTVPKDGAFLAGRGPRRVLELAWVQIHFFDRRHLHHLMRSR